MSKRDKRDKNEFQVGQTVYAVKTAQQDHFFGFDDDGTGRKPTGMQAFASGSAGEVVEIDGKTIRVKVAGYTHGYMYTPSELSHVPRGTKVTIATFDGKRPVKKSAKKVDGVIKTLYAIVKDGTIVGVHPDRPSARNAKKILGGLKAGVTIVTYTPQSEIR